MLKKISVTVIATVAALMFIPGGGVGSNKFGPSKAEAGCVTGAIVGGLAGHFIGRHGLAGAAAGCAGGAYMEHRRNEQYRRDYNDYDNRYNYNRGYDNRQYQRNYYND